MSESATLGGASRAVAGDPPASAQPVAVLANSGVEPLTADFFRGLIGENTKQITQRIDAITLEITGLTKSMGENRGWIEKAEGRLVAHDAGIEAHTNQINDLDARLARLEAGTPLASGGKTTPSSSYLWARRSVRFWPIDLTNEKTMWNGAGEFIHSALGVLPSEICQDDIEAIVPATAPRVPAGNLNNEAIVTFFCPRKRDIVMAKVGGLAKFTDNQGKPTAGVRLEIPPLLQDTFRLLSRFGAHLRARHGEGTRRHIRFDDVECSLVSNIKLPGDEKWSRVTPDMAKKDLEEMTRTESRDVLKRISAEKTSVPPPGPRQRLAAPMDSDTLSAGVQHRPWRPRTGPPS